MKVRKVIKLSLSRRKVLREAGESEKFRRLIRRKILIQLATKLIFKKLSEGNGLIRRKPFLCVVMCLTLLLFATNVYAQKIDSD